MVRCHLFPFHYYSFSFEWVSFLLFSVVLFHSFFISTSCWFLFDFVFFFAVSISPDRSGHLQLNQVLEFEVSVFSVEEEDEEPVQLRCDAGTRSVHLQSDTQLPISLPVRIQGIFRWTLGTGCKSSASTERFWGWFGSQCSSGAVPVHL